MTEETALSPASKRVQARVESLQRSDTLVKELLANSGTPQEQLVTLESLTEVMRLYRDDALRAVRAQRIAGLEAAEGRELRGQLRRVPRALNEIEELTAIEDE